MFKAQLHSLGVGSQNNIWGTFVAFGGIFVNLNLTRGPFVALVAFLTILALAWKRNRASPPTSPIKGEKGRGLITRVVQQNSSFGLPCLLAKPTELNLSISH
jgi:hypothetical protein